MNEFVGLDPTLAEAAASLVREASFAGLQPRITSGYRSYAHQARLYRRYPVSYTHLTLPTKA